MLSLALSPGAASQVAWTVVAASCCATGLGMACWWLVRSARRPRASLARCERGTAVFEFPFALLLLIVLVMLTWQLALMASAYLVVDYSAFVAARALAVKAGERGGRHEPRGRFVTDDEDLVAGTKGRFATSAAVLALVPIAGEAPKGQRHGHQSLADQAFEAVKRLKMPGQPEDLLTRDAIHARLVYGHETTRVKLIDPLAKPDEDTGEAPAEQDLHFEGGRSLTVQVEHDFELLIPFARRIFGSRRKGTGKHVSYVSEIIARATIVAESFGPEKVPDGAREGVLP